MEVYLVTSETIFMTLPPLCFPLFSQHLALTGIHWELTPWVNQGENVRYFRQEQLWAGAEARMHKCLLKAAHGPFSKPYVPLKAPLIPQAFPSTPVQGHSLAICCSPLGPACNCLPLLLISLLSRGELRGPFPLKRLAVHYCWEPEDKKNHI